SGYNCLTTTYNIAVTPAAGPFIIYEEHTLDDNAGGNANGLPDYGEDILMTVNLHNAGAADAINVTATLSTESELINITDGDGEYGTIIAGSSAGILNDFAFEIDEYVPDQEIIDFLLDISDDGKESWTDAFNIILNAPVLETGLMVIDDVTGGNGDGFLDPGETATLTIGVLNNGHADAFNAEATLNTASSWLSITSNSFALGDLLQGINSYATFEVSVDEDTPIGTMAVFSFNVTSGAYNASEDYGTIIGVLVEDWESAGFTTFNWQFAADAPWEISTSEPYEGIYCARSGDINDNQESELFLYTEVLADGDMSFYRKLSSEAEWDFLRFYIDYTLMGEWSGELDWEMVSYPVTQDFHTFRWVYEKDSYTSSGEDCAWVDFIVFPPVDIATGIIHHNNDEGDFTINISPNPARSNLNIAYTLGSSTEVEIVIYDLLGHKIMNVMTNAQHQEGEYNLQLDVSGIRSGIYLCRISTLEGMLSMKLIIQ
ncbi:MAG: hypothetical protein DRJ15_14755, partial [Bacteroidetes bacterium]